MKHKGYNEKRQKIIDTAKKIFNEKSFEETSVDDILNEVKISRGTFYHYFNSKLELLDEIIKTFTDKFAEQFREVAYREDLNAVEKLTALYNVGENHESQDKSLMLQVITVYFKEENLKYKKRLHDRFLDILIPIYSKVFQQGKDEGTLDVIDPVETANFFIQSFDIIRETNIQEILSTSPDVEKIYNRVNMFLRYFERMMKIPEGTFKGTPRECFGDMLDNLKK